MKNNTSYLIFGFVITFLLMSIIFLALSTKEDPKKPEQATTENTESDASKDVASKDADSEKTTSSGAGEIFEKKGCVSCHSISKLNVKGGSTGPDLSDAYKTVDGKHGKPIDEFLKKPSSAVMSGVIKDNPLTDKERKDIVDALKEASEK
ncbi:c-type cytochrome [Macrococcus sp. EM39E]|uniref:c-type cytochrome n=1 Tax=Macrococcus animalis TaxID=3395467 RepID=UPI0039BE6B80